MKTGDGATHREFESHTLRQKTTPPKGWCCFLACGRFEPSKCNSPVDCCSRRLDGAKLLFSPKAKMQSNLHSPHHPTGGFLFWPMGDSNHLNATVRWTVATKTYRSFRFRGERILRLRFAPLRMTFPYGMVFFKSGSPRHCAHRLTMTILYIMLQFTNRCFFDIIGISSYRAKGDFI